MKVIELSGNVIYIEDAFPLHKEFIEAIEINNENKLINDVVPPWSEWLDGYPIDGVWTPTEIKGYKKVVDWDYTINNQNSTWPRTDVGPEYSQAHKISYDIIKMIDEPYRDVLKIWAEKTGNKEIDLITKNYTIKKYNPGGSIAAHTDRDNNHDFNTFDWTALVYLNDDYTGGDLVFDNLGYRLSPKAGSILLFPADELHTAEKVLSGHKYFLFFYIQSKFGFTHSIDEAFAPIVQNIKRDRRKT